MSFVKFLHGEDPFVRVPNDTARDRRLSPNALSILVFAGSFPESVSHTFADFTQRFTLGRDALRTAFNILEECGYGCRQHRVRQPDGRLVTVTMLSFYPIFLDGSTGGGSSALGSAADGSPTLKERKPGKEGAQKKPRKKPYRRKAAGTRARESDLEKQLGIRFPQEVQDLGNPDRVAALLLGAHFRVEDGRPLEAGDFRLVLAEFSASVWKARDPWALLETLSRLAAIGKLNLSLEGEERMSAWA